MQGYNVETTFPLLNVMRISAHRNWLHTVKMFPLCKPLPMFFFKQENIKSESSLHKKKEEIYDKYMLFKEL